MAPVIVRLAEKVFLVGQNAVVVRRAAPKHGARRVHAAQGRRHDVGVTVPAPAGLIHDAIVRRIDEADERRVFPIEEGVGLGGIGARGISPGLLVARQDVSPFHGLAILEATWARPACHGDSGVAAVTVRAAQRDGGARMHGGLVGAGVTGDATSATRWVLFALDIRTTLLGSAARLFQAA